MNSKKTNIAALAALTIILGVGLADRAEAKIRVRGTVRTPHGVIHVDNGPAPRVIYRERALPVRHYQKTKVSKRDRRIAKRLARYTGVPKRELIHLKRMGYRWNEIGNWLGISRRAVKAAKQSRSWDRFLRHERRNSRRGGYRGYDDWYDN
jgi:hypothetical protein